MKRTATSRPHPGEPHQEGITAVSFVRFGTDGSQVYIYEINQTDADGRLLKVCHNCALLGGSWLRTGVTNFETSDLTAMLKHLAEHRAAGHRVPDWLDDDLGREWVEEP